MIQKTRSSHMPFFFFKKTCCCIFPSFLQGDSALFYLWKKTTCICIFCLHVWNRDIDAGIFGLFVLSIMARQNWNWMSVMLCCDAVGECQPECCKSAVERLFWKVCSYGVMQLSVQPSATKHVCICIQATGLKKEKFSVLFLSGVFFFGLLERRCHTTLCRM